MSEVAEFINHLVNFTFKGGGAGISIIFPLNKGGVRGLLFVAARIWSTRVMIHIL
jgi:hypothetical protein